MNYINLIQYRLRGKLNSADEQVLDTWLEADEKHQKEAADYEDVWQASNTYEPTIHPDVEAGLAKLQQRMAAAKRAEQPSTAKVVRMNSRRRWLSIAASAAVLVIAAWFWQTTSSTTWTNVSTASGETQQLILPDGSSVLLNENSTLAYNDFEGEERSLQLKGEAFFEVTKNPIQPFVVQAEDATVTVLGTSFNIRSFEEEATTEVTVRTGKVAFQAKKGQQEILTKGQQATYHKKNQRTSRGKDVHLNALAWQSGFLKFDNESLDNIVKQLSKTYRVAVSIENEKMQQCTYSSTIFTQKISIEDALQTYVTAFGFELQKTAKGYLLAGGTSCK